jgi:hypothetical protein
VVLVRGSVDGALRMPVPFDGVRGVGVLERVARPVVVGGRAPGADDVDFEGEAGVLACLGGDVNGRDVEADGRGLIDGVVVGACAGAGAEVGAEAEGGGGAGASCATTGPSPSTADETAPGAPPAAVEAKDSGGAPSSDARGARTDAVPRNVEADVEPVPFVLPFVLTGGHSRAMRCSSLVASPVLLEVALVERDGGPDEEG